MRFRSLPLLVTTLAALLYGPAFAAASETATGNVVVTAQFATRTSLTVSTRLLHFDVTVPGEPATVAVDFSAGARTPSGAEVVLSVEPLLGLQGPGGAADVEAELSFSGIGDGAASGVMDARRPAIAGKWVGSGLRTGRLVFALRASASGSYSLPVRFVLTTP
jgi:hypothetical protein